MTVSVLRTGPLDVNTLIVPLCGNKVLVIDPAACRFSGDESAVVDYLAAQQLEAVAVILTHGHFDHVSGLSLLHRNFPALPIAVHAADADLLGAESAHMQGVDLRALRFEAFLSTVSALPEPTAFLEDGKTLADCLPALACDHALFAALGKWLVLHTPGHTAGSCCLYNASERLLVSGDTVFYHSWGRSDLRGGNERQLQQSLRRIATTVSAETLIYPGHDQCGFTASDNF